MILNTRLRVTNNFLILIIFIEINVNVCLLCDHVMKGIILHTRRPNCQYKTVIHLVFEFQLIFFFRILRILKARF